MEEKIYWSFISCIFLLILSLIAVLFFYGFSSPDFSAETEVTTGFFNPTLIETKNLGQEYIDKITFLGESTTYGFERYGLLDASKVWTGATAQNGIIKTAGTLSLSPSIDKTRIYHSPSGEAITIGEAVCRDRPEILIITLGLNNGVSYYSEEEFKQCYRILLNAIIGASEKTTVILQSLFPVSSACKIKAFTPERISLCNRWVYDLAAEFHLGYLDTVSVLSDENGYLLPEYDNGGDGIHLNQEGLQAVLSYICTHGITQTEVYP